MNTMLQKANVYVEKNALNRKELKWYPSYHSAAPVGWINDPNGMCCFDGKYHLFYQYHPYGVTWGPMHWGHVTSTDMVNWKDEAVALAPDMEYDKNGCFSGSAIAHDGKMYLLYTGHVDLKQEKPEDKDRIETQCLAVSEDGINFEKIEKNPVMTLGNIDYAFGGHFRDPKVWKHEDMFYTIVGSQKDEVTGQVLLFSSKDMVNWQPVGVMASGEGNQGFMWECPNFAEVDGKDVMVFSPQGVNPEGRRFLNKHQSGFFVGKLNYETGKYEHGKFDMLDYGSDFYAPQIMNTPDGRVVMIGWLDMWDRDYPEQEEGWAGMMTIPRELHIKGDKVVSTPVKEMEILRNEHIEVSSVEVKAEKQFAGMTGTAFELVLEADMANADEFSIKLETLANEEAVLSYDKKIGVLTMDCTNCGTTPKNKREVEIALTDNKLKLDIFVDKSSVEAFINDGERVMSARVYPMKPFNVVFESDGTTVLNNADFYTLNSIY